MSIWRNPFTNLREIKLELHEIQYISWISTRLTSNKIFLYTFMLKKSNDSRILFRDSCIDIPAISQPGETSILRFGARKFVRVIDHSLSPDSDSTSISFLWISTRLEIVENFRGCWIEGVRKGGAIRYARFAATGTRSRILAPKITMRLQRDLRNTSLTRSILIYAYNSEDLPPLIDPSLYSLAATTVGEVLDRTEIEMCHFGYRCHRYTHSVEFIETVWAEPR